MTTALKKSEIRHPTPEIQMARQLSEQYQRAVGGLWEVVKFGAMMMHLQNTLFPELVGNGNAKKFESEGEGLKAWLAENCPELNRRTAYRFKGLAEGLQKEFKLGEPADLHRLLTASEDDLNRADRKTREEIAGFLEGQSQRQLQFRLLSDRGEAPPVTRGPQKQQPLNKLCCIQIKEACAQFLLMRSHMPDLYFDSACSRLLKTLEEATACRWSPDPERARENIEFIESAECFTLES
jgi:hypothetical protein